MNFRFDLLRAEKTNKIIDSEDLFWIKSKHFHSKFMSNFFSQFILINWYVSIDLEWIAQQQRQKHSLPKMAKPIK